MLDAVLQRFTDTCQQNAMSPDIGPHKLSVICALVHHRQLLRTRLTMLQAMLGEDVKQMASPVGVEAFRTLESYDDVSIEGSSIPTSPKYPYQSP